MNRNLQLYEFWHINQAETVGNTSVIYKLLILNTYITLQKYEHLWKLCGNVTLIAVCGGPFHVPPGRMFRHPSPCL